MYSNVDSSYHNQQSTIDILLRETEVRPCSTYETTLLNGVIYIIIIIAGHNRQVNRGRGITMLQLLGPHPNLIVHRGDETIFHC